MENIVILNKKNDNCVKKISFIAIFGLIVSLLMLIYPDNSAISLVGLFYQCFVLIYICKKLDVIRKRQNLLLLFILLLCSLSLLVASNIHISHTSTTCAGCNLPLDWSI